MPSVEENCFTLNSFAQCFSFIDESRIGTRETQAIMTAVRTSSQRWFSPDVIAAMLVLRTIKSHFNLSLLPCKLKQ